VSGTDSSMDSANVEFDARSIWEDREERGGASKSAIGGVVWGAGAAVGVWERVRREMELKLTLVVESAKGGAD